MLHENFLYQVFKCFYTIVKSLVLSPYMPTSSAFIESSGRFVTSSSLHKPEFSFVIPTFRTSYISSDRITTGAFFLYDYHLLFRIMSYSRSDNTSGARSADNLLITAFRAFRNVLFNLHQSPASRAELQLCHLLMSWSHIRRCIRLLKS